MKRYIYTSIGVVVVIVALVIIGFINQPKKAENVITPYNPTSNSASPTTPSKATETANPATPTTGETNAPTTPTDPNETIATPSPKPTLTEDGEKIVSASVLKQNPDGTIEFIDGDTGAVQAPINPTVENQTPVTVGKGSDVDKKNATVSFLKHINALHEGNWAEACKYIQLPPGLTDADCQSKLEKRTTSTPITTSFTIADTAGNDINGDTAVVVGTSFKDSNGNFGQPTLLHRTANPEVWLVDGKQLTEIK